AGVSEGGAADGDGRARLEEGLGVDEAGAKGDGAGGAGEAGAGVEGVIALEDRGSALGEVDSSGPEAAAGGAECGADDGDLGVVSECAADGQEAAGGQGDLAVVGEVGEGELAAAADCEFALVDLEGGDGGKGRGGAGDGDRS